MHFSIFIIQFNLYPISLFPHKHHCFTICAPFLRIITHYFLDLHITLYSLRQFLTHCFTPVRLTHNLEWSVPCPVTALWSSVALLTLSHHSFLESYSDLVSKYVYQFFPLRLFFSLLTSPATFIRATSLSILALDFSTFLCINKISPSQSKFELVCSFRLHTKLVTQT